MTSELLKLKLLDKADIQNETKNQLLKSISHMGRLTILD